MVGKAARDDDDDDISIENNFLAANLNGVSWFYVLKFVYF